MPSLQLIKVRQRFERPRLPDIETSLNLELQPIASMIYPGAKITIAVGSRGISNIAHVVKTAADFVRQQEAVPFIIPAMGSHGGATAAGQVTVLASYGITEKEMDAPIRSSLDTVELTRAGSANRVFMDRYAHESDGVILINRIKPHTDYHGPYESGLVKMSVIGLGKHDQALEMHSFGVYGLRELIPSTAEQILATGKILAGIALIENAYDETMTIKVLRADAIMTEEPKLLGIARANMPQLPVEQVDVLIVDQMGKNISGVGLDPNIIGRIRIRGEIEPERPQIKSIVVTDLTDESHGNALGMGLADVITQRLFDKIDLTATYENIITSTFLERGKIPVIAKNDAQAYAFARRSCGSIPAGQLRIVRMRDTLHLDEVYVSEPILNDISGRDDIEVIGEPVDMFDGSGDLFPF